MRFILLGPPGVGKGTQGAKISEKYGIPKLSIGEILRKEAADGSVLGKKVASTINRGEFVSDDIVEQLVEQRLLSSVECQKGFILDGFPRNINQALALTQILKKLPPVDTIVVHIDASREQLILRLIDRVTCRDCGCSSKKASLFCFNCGSYNLYSREDDVESETIVQRLNIYDERTKPLIEYYHNDSNWIEVNGDQSIDLVFSNIVEAVDNLLKNSKNS